VALRAGTYLQDGTNLYRFECFLPQGGGVLLEDCWSDTVISLSLKEFTNLRLRRVERDGDGDRKP
jgi:hypothetical protein